MIDQLFEIICDRQKEDVDRLAAMQELLLAIDDEPERTEAIQSTLIAIITGREDDELVRQHAAKELQLYRISDLDKSLLNILSDSSEDLDIRINLLCAVEHLPNQQLADCLSKLDATDELRKYVR